MALLPLRPLEPSGDSVDLYDDWLSEIAGALERGEDRWELCRRTLTGIFYPQLAGVDPASLPLASRAALAQMDARNVTLEPEYYAEIDAERFRDRKPLLWMWQMFDRSPLGANVHLGVRFRPLLAPLVHRNVLLDDRGGIVLGDRVSISDYANVYSHTHSIVDQLDVTNATTVIGDGVRITYHATVLAGTRVGENAMVGAMAVATRDVRPWHVNVGIPAKSVRVKPNAPPEAYKNVVCRTRDAAETPEGSR